MRKICVNCKCRKESHDLKEEDYQLEEVYSVLGVKIPDRKNLFSYTTPKNKKMQQVEWFVALMLGNRKYKL